jgi:hypothetical protein
VSVPSLPSSALRDLLGILRVLWWVRWGDGADEVELHAIASVGHDVARLLRASRFEACATVWHQARLAMRRVVTLGDEQPSSTVVLHAAARRVLAVPGIPPPPLHAYAAPGGPAPGEDLDGLGQQPEYE